MFVGECEKFINFSLVDILNFELFDLDRCCVAIWAIGGFYKKGLRALVSDFISSFPFWS